MTLHWWMHWFWVTLLTLLVCSGITAAPPSAPSAPSAPTEDHLTTDPTERPSERQGRAMYFSKPQITTKAAPLANATEPTWDPHSLEVLPKTETTTTTPTPTVEWTAINTTAEDDEAVDPPKNVSNMNLNTTAVDAVANTTNDAQNATSKKRNLTVQDFVKEDTVDGVSESRIFTEKPLSLETTFLQTRIPPNRRAVDDEGMDTGAIAGISFAALVLVALAGSTAFVLYRRRYLNKPQTLNDKCSNPDSSGYLDDSTIRDNSEEMYSLDNDSFLNSLEAMTIQNYWTDTVKHTKL